MSAKIGRGCVWTCQGDLLVSGGGSPEAGFLKEAAGMGATPGRWSRSSILSCGCRYADGKLTRSLSLDM